MTNKTYRFAAVAAVLLALCLVFMAPVSAGDISNEADLRTAIESAPDDGAIIQLSGNIEVSAPITISKSNIVIDGNYYTLSADDGFNQGAGRLLRIHDSNNVTLKNITIENQNLAKGLMINKSGTELPVVLENVVVNASYGSGITVSGNLTAKNVTVQNSALMQSIEVHADGCKANITLLDGTYGKLGDFLKIGDRFKQSTVIVGEDEENFNLAITHGVEIMVDELKLSALLPPSAWYDYAVERNAWVSEEDCTVDKVQTFLTEWLNNAKSTFAESFDASILEQVYLNTVAAIKKGGVVSVYPTLEDAVNDADANTPVTVLQNVDLGATSLVISDKSVTLDLNGKTISGNVDGAIIKVTNSGVDVTIKNGTVTNSAAKHGLHVTDSAVLTVDNLTVTSGMDTILVGTKSSLSSGTLIIGGSKTKVTGTDTAILFYGASSSVTVTGGSFTGTNYGAIWGSGTATDGSSLTVTGGDINVGGGVDDDERTAIFIPHDGSVTISGGKITGPNALQILGKGPLSISGGIFTATGSVPEDYSKVGDGPVNAGSAVSIIYRAGDYGAAGELDASITGGTFSSNNGGIALRVLNVSEDGTVHDNTSLLKNVKFISGGQFSSQPLAQFLVDNYISSESNGLWTVSYKAPSTPSTNTGSTSSSTTSKPKDEPPVEEPVTPTEPVAGEVTVETEVTNGGEVSFETPAAEGSEPVADAPVEISAVVLPEGTTGEVAFVPVSEQPAPAGKETQTKKVFEINVPTYEKGKAAVVKFTMTVAELAADGKTAAEVALWHFDEETGEWTKLVTSYTIVDGVVYFEAITYDFSPFAIIYEDAVEQPEQPVEEPETPASPAPVLGVLAALGAAVVLRRK